MSNINRSVRKLQESRAEDFRILSQLTRDLEAELAGPKKVKIKIGPKYVEGVTKSQGDAQYESELRNTTAQMMGRAFGKNLDLGDVAQDLKMELEASLGTEGILTQYVELAVQVFCHVVANAVKRASSKSPLSTLSNAKTDFVTAIESSTGGLVKAYEGLSAYGLIAGNVRKYLYPLSSSHIEAVTAEARQIVNLYGDYRSYIAQPAAQNAVALYISKGNSVPSNVLLPAAIGLATSQGAANTSSGVKVAFEKYNDKDIKATFDFYFKAVKSELDMSQGIRTGDAQSQINGAIAALSAASDSLKLTGLSSNVVSKFRSGFSAISKELKRIKPLARTADESIGFATLGLLDLIGGLSNMGTQQVSLNGISGFQSGPDTLKNYVLTQIGSEIYSNYDNEPISFLDAQDNIRPVNITTQNRRNVLFAAVQNNLGQAFMNLEDAYLSVVPLGTLPQQRGVTQKEVKVTGKFKELVTQQVQANVANLDSVLNNTRLKGKLDDNIVKAAYVEVLDLVLGLTTLNNAALTPQTVMTLQNQGVILSNKLALSESMYNRIADGRIASLKSVGPDGRTLKQQLIDFVDVQFRNQTGRTNASVRTATRDAVIRSADLLIATLNGLRVQAENIGMQTRQNPMGGGLLAADTYPKQVGVGAIALYSDHASAALINRFAEPTAGSIGAYASDYGVSVATALWGASFVSGMQVPVLNANGEKNEGLGYSMIAGAGLHALLRTLYKNNIGNLRFSDNVIAKIGQALVTAPAHLLGDSSMGYSALNPANAQGHEKDLGQWLANLVRVSPKSTICQLGIQLWQHGLSMSVGTDNNISFNASVSDVVIEDLTKLTSDQKATLAATVGALNALCACVCHGCKLEISNGSILLSAPAATDLEATKEFAALKTKVKEASKSCKAEAAKILGLDSLGTYLYDGLGGFIQEPGYNLDVYSGEDHVNYLQPAPIQTAQSGIAQLDAAIARAARLSHHEKIQEGIEDMVEVEVIRATPTTARMAEEAGIGVSLGASRANPQTEVVALEVMGANTLMDIVPARQYSVPQGALNYPRIQPAQNIQVASDGLFNRGAFTPVFSG